MIKNTSKQHSKLFYSNEFENYLKRHNMMQLGMGYKTVAIIGCQASGKSKLYFINIIRYTFKCII